MVPTEAPHHGPGAARKRRRGGTGGSNRGPASRTMAPRAKEFWQRHRTPMRLPKNWQRHRGPMRLPKNRPRPPAAGALCQGVDPDFASGPFYQNGSQNFKISKFKFWKIKTTLAQLFRLSGHDTIKRKCYQFPWGKTPENECNFSLKFVLFVFAKIHPILSILSEKKSTILFLRSGPPKLLPRLAGYNTL